jgi:DtxR family Mn-dependent transcriptional regulator
MTKPYIVSRLSAAEETYIETIDALIKKHGYTGVCTLARALNFKPSSVSQMLKKLSVRGFVVHEPYCPVTLTKKGQALADFLKQQQRSLQRFFMLLDVDEHIAEQDACKIEHILHETTLERLAQYVAFLENAVHHSDGCVSCFRTYRKNMNPI